MPSRHELVAYGKNTEEIAIAIGADLVIFQTLPDLISSVRQFNPSITNFDCSVFTGEYVTGGVAEEYLLHLEQLRSDNVKERLGETKRELENATSVIEDKEKAVGCSGPMNGTDDTVGLYNSWNSKAP